ncbi:hypothetical protein GCM10028801_46240 [Nocardioides maradonensis]
MLVSASVVIVLAAGAAIFTLTGRHSSTRNPVHTLRGTLLVDAVYPSSDHEWCGQILSAGEALDQMDKMLTRNRSQPCSAGPGGGYDDIRDGADVTVYDASGKILATGQLSGGTADEHGVEFSWTVENVPEQPVIQVEVSHRGKLNYTLDRLKADNWSVANQLGG